MFKQWINKKSLGILPISEKEFLSTKENAILKGNNIELNRFASEHFAYRKLKGLEFISRFNGKFIIGEVRYITAEENLYLESEIKEAAFISIIDGIPNGSYYKKLSAINPNNIVISILVLREFLYSFTTNEVS